MSESEAAQELGGTGYTGDEQWSDEQVLQALGDAGRSEFGDEPAPEQATAPTPEGATDAAPEAQVQAEAEVAPEPTQTETFDGGKFNPDNLPPELQDGWRQLQAAFTQKTQELAAQRQQFEALGDPEAVQQAIDLYNRIGDPTNWQQLHAELTQAMQGMGMTPFEAQQAATAAMTPEPAAPAPDQFEGLDPEVASLAQQLQQTRAELDQFKQGFQEQLVSQEAERQYIQAVTELQKQEAAIREAHPQWGDDKIEAAYQLSSFYNGSLAQGAARLEQVLAAERELYLSQKAGAMDDSTRTPATTFSPDTSKVKEPETLAEAEAAATEEFMARLAELDS